MEHQRAGPVVQIEQEGIKIEGEISSQDLAVDESEVSENDANLFQNLI